MIRSWTWFQCCFLTCSRSQIMSHFLLLSKLLSSFARSGGRSICIKTSLNLRSSSASSGIGLRGAPAATGPVLRRAPMASTFPCDRGGSPSWDPDGPDPEVWFPIRMVMGTSLEASLKRRRKHFILNKAVLETSKRKTYSFKLNGNDNIWDPWFRGKYS